MKEWVLSVCAVVLLSVLLDLILTEGRVKKYVVGFVRVVLVFTMISPVLRSLNGEADLSFDVSSEAIVDEPFLTNTARKRFDLYEEALEKELSEIGETDVSIDLSFENGQTSVYAVAVTFQNPVINEREDNTIVIEKVKSIVKRYLGVEEEIIAVYGLGDQ